MNSHSHSWTFLTPPQFCSAIIKRQVERRRQSMGGGAIKEARGGCRCHQACRGTAGENRGMVQEQGGHSGRQWRMLDAGQRSVQRLRWKTSGKGSAGVGEEGNSSACSKLLYPISGSVLFSSALRHAVSTICWPMRETSTDSGPCRGRSCSRQWRKYCTGFCIGGCGISTGTS